MRALCLSFASPNLLCASIKTANTASRDFDFAAKASNSMGKNGGCNGGYLRLSPQP